MAARGSRWTSERGALWTLDLDGTALHSVTPRCTASFSEARAGDAQSLAAAMGLPDPEPVLQRLNGVRRCFIVRAEHTNGTSDLSQANRETPLAAYGWVSRGHEYVGELERTFQIPKGEVYIWNCVTLPEYRGRRLYSALLSYMLATLQSEGVRRVWIGAALANRPSVQGIVNAGFEPVIRLVYARLFNLHYMWIMSSSVASGRRVTAARRMVIIDHERALGRLVVGIG